ncbi:hypothetical protein GF339_12275 [candidate division KSB3 bacterium]|uniref:Uroporphyrinogen decarboxylase (URO-D) domain-containing protein n=1 Tax=candidate division KSB3 bacterium TaxID=2044937 RepID=A0A9D5JWT5_9BACT|nr:hypothetical protein [candidate division KSB3 bacterium]MBD3325357.1 hypothetical protein [candidate division KSB3 bacterium]
MNDQRQVEDKIRAYQKFWQREEVSRPLIGFDIGGFFSLRRFPALCELEDGAVLSPELLAPENYLAEYEAFYRRSAAIADDLIKGVAPIPAIPWIEAMLGCQVRISQASQSIWVEERNASWEELETLQLEDDNPWLLTYLDFLAALERQAEGRYPVGQPFFRGITDLIGALRGHNQALIDCLEQPQRIRRLAHQCADVLSDVTRKQYEVIQPYQDGYFVEQFSLWSPDITVRLQEDASAIYSPRLYRDLIQDADRALAGAFPYSLIHLHSSSLFLLDDFLAITDMDAFEVNKDVGGLSVEEMLPFFQTIQAHDRCLVIRGELTREDIAVMQNQLSPNGLLLQIVVDQVSAIDQYQGIREIAWG